MNEMASIAAEAFCKKHESDTDVYIKIHPHEFLQHTIPYLTVRTLHRHEKALKSLEADSRWIKRLTFVLGALTLALVYYAWRLDAVHSPPVTPPASTSSPTASPNKQPQQ